MGEGVLGRADLLALGAAADAVAEVQFGAARLMVRQCAVEIGDQTT
jgi:hypothetical protein